MLTASTVILNGSSSDHNIFEPLTVLEITHLKLLTGQVVIMEYIL